MATTATDSASDEVQLDAEAKRLKLEQTKAEARKAIAEAQQATLAAEIPTSDVKPLEGKVELGAGVGLLAALLAHAVLERGADEIVKALPLTHVEGKSKGNTVLIVEDRALVESDWPYTMVSSQLEVLSDNLGKAETLLQPPTEKPHAPAVPATTEEMLLPAAALAAAPALVGAVAGLIGMFKTDYSIASKDVTVGTTPLVAAVAGELLAAGHTVIVDKFTLLAEESPLIKGFRDAREVRNNVYRLVSQLKSEQLDPADHRISTCRTELEAATKAYYDALAKAPATPPKDLETPPKDLETRIGDLRRDLKEAEGDSASARWHVAFAEAAIGAFDTFTTAITSATGTGDPPLIAAALREHLHMPKDVTHVLYVGLESSGGETITRRSLFGRSGQVAYMGGTQISYMLLDVPNKNLVAAGTTSEAAYLPFDLKNAQPGHAKPVTIAVPRRGEE